MPTDLSVILAAGFIGIIITLIIGFILLRIDAGRTTRENIRLQTALARQGQNQGGSSYNQNDGELGFLGNMISEIITKNPEVVTNLIGNITKKE